MFVRKNRFLMEMIRGAELSEDLLQGTSVVGCFYGKMAALGELGSRIVPFFSFEGDPVNTLQVRDRMKGVLSTSLKLVEKRTKKSISCLVGGVVGIDSV